MLSAIQVQRHTTKVQIKDWNVVSIKSHGCNMDINVRQKYCMVVSHQPDAFATRQNNHSFLTLYYSCGQKSLVSNRESMPQTTIMFRPIRSVEHLACFCNHDADNLLLEKQCSAQNGAKSVAFSMTMIPAFVRIYSQSLE